MTTETKVVPPDMAPRRGCEECAGLVADLRATNAALLAACEAMLDANYMPGSRHDLAMAARTAIALARGD